MNSLTVVLIFMGVVFIGMLLLIAWNTYQERLENLADLNSSYEEIRKLREELYQKEHPSPSAERRRKNRDQRRANKRQN